MTSGGQPVLSRDEESELVTGLLEGDTEAFEIFYGLFAGPLTRFACNWVAPEDAEEITDDVLLEAAAAVDRYDPNRSEHTSLGLWLVVRCRSRAIDRARRARRRTATTPLTEEVESDEGVSPAQAVTLASSDDPEREVVARWELREFWASLSEQEREVVGLHHFYGLAYDQVAERMGLQVSTVHEYSKRARAKLKKRV